MPNSERLSFCLQSIKKRVLHLGYPYAIFAILGTFLYFILLRRLIPSLEVDSVKALVGIFINDYCIGELKVNGFWFVQDLIYVSILYTALAFICSNKYIRYIICTILILLALLIFGGSRHIFLGRILAGLYFFCLGDCFFKSFLKINNILLLVLLVVFFYTSYINAPVLMEKASFGKPFLFFLSSNSGVLLLFSLSKKLKHLQILQYVGRNTLIILFFHFYFLWISRFLFANMIGVDNNYQFPIYLIHFVIALSGSLMVVYLQNKFYPGILKYPF